MDNPQNEFVERISAGKGEANRQATSHCGVRLHESLKSCKGV